MENFDPKSAASAIENIGYVLLHNGRAPFEDVIGPMGELDPRQASALINQLRLDNLKPNGLPTVESSVGVDGHIEGFSFTPALSDQHPVSTPFVAVSTGHKDSGIAPKAR